MSHPNKFQSQRPPSEQFYQSINQQQQQQEGLHHNQIYNHNQNYHTPPQAVVSQPTYSPQTQFSNFQPPLQYQPHFQSSSGVACSTLYLPAGHQNNTTTIPNYFVPPPFHQVQSPNIPQPPSNTYPFQSENQGTPPATSYVGFRSTQFSGFHSVQSNVITSKSKKTQRDADQDWVDNWSKNKKQKWTLSNNKSSQNITEARSVLLDTLMLLKELHHLKELLNEMIAVDEEEWKVKLQEAWALKDKLQAMVTMWNSAVLNDMKRKLKKRQMKRARQKAKRQEEKEEQQKRTAEREEIHRIIDTHRNSVQEKVLEKKRKREMQAEADNILSEVKRKIHDTRRAQECTKVLEKLRQIRKENSQKKGLHVTRESDEAFQERIAGVKELLQKQMSIYEAEERALKVMLESEREEQRELENTKKQEKILELVSQKEEELQEHLFGGNDLDPCHPLYFYWQYYTQAERSLESLLQIRSHWDTFLVDKDNEDGSCMPVQWVLPSRPSSDLWTNVLSEDC